MTYVLREQVNNRYYCKDHNKIIEFDTIDEARLFLNNFANFAMAMGMSTIMQNPGVMNDIQQVCQSTTIDEKPACDCEFVNYKKIKEEKGIK